jgi:hypothetical protein
MIATFRPPSQPLNSRECEFGEDLQDLKWQRILPARGEFIGSWFPHLHPFLSFFIHLAGLSLDLP